MKLRALFVLGKYSTRELHPMCFVCFLSAFCYIILKFLFSITSCLGVRHYSVLQIVEKLVMSLPYTLLGKIS